MNLSLSDLRELLTGSTNNTAPANDSMVGCYVVVRTYSAGVHVGVLTSRNGREVVLSNARRIWRWTGANTLSEISLHGVGADSRVSESVPSILLTEAIEITPCSAEAERNLRGAKWTK